MQPVRIPQDQDTAARLFDAYLAADGRQAREEIARQLAARGYGVRNG